MALLQIISAEHIQKLEEAEQDKYHRVLDNYQQNRDAADGTKELWLGVYARGLSPSVACRQSGVSLATYKRWRNTDAAFCRAINNVIVDSMDELKGSVLARATGYVRLADVNEPTDSGYEEDASGKIIRHGASDTLAKAVLGLDKPEAQSGGGPVNVVIDMRALTGAAHIEARGLGKNHAEPILIESPPEGDDE